MSDKPYKLTREEMEELKEFNDDYRKLTTAIENAKRFNLGDFLVLYTGDKLTIRKNSYGAPDKFKVVYISDYGMPFVKSVNKLGTPVGPLMDLMGGSMTDYAYDSDFKFELDPDYADALLLQQPYDPAVLHKSKQEIWKQVMTHNKSIKISNDLATLAAFFDGVKVGDVLWNSPNSCYIVDEKVTVTKKEYNSSYKHGPLRTDVKGPNITILTLRDKNGKTIKATPDFFECKALYKERPRTYKELNI
jgi:hypothetical protein